MHKTFGIRVYCLSTHKNLSRIIVKGHNLQSNAISLSKHVQMCIKLDYLDNLSWRRRLNRIWNLNSLSRRRRRRLVGCWSSSSRNWRHSGRLRRWWTVYIGGDSCLRRTTSSRRRIVDGGGSGGSGNWHGLAGHKVCDSVGGLVLYSCQDWGTP